MVIAPDTILTLPYRSPLLFRKVFGPFGNPTESRSDLSQAREVYGNIVSIFEDSAHQNNTDVEHNNLVGRSQLARRTPSNQMAQYQFKTHIRPLGVYATGSLDMFSNTQRVTTKTSPTHATLEIRVHGQHNLFYEKIAHELRYVSDLIFPQRQGYVGGWPLLEKDGTLKQFGQLDRLL